MLYTIQVQGLPPPSPELVAEYESLNGVPPVLLDNTLYAKNAEQAEALCKTFTGDREGYANTREFQSAEGM